MSLNWLKLDINILNDSKIKIIRKYPDGDKMIILWIGLLCLAMKSNETGMIYITSGIPYTIQDLSIEFEIEEKTVELALQLFKRFNMIDIAEGGMIEVINFEKHQSLDKINNVKKMAAERVKKYRENKKLLCNADVTQCNADVTQCNADVTLNVTQCNATDLDLDIDLDIDKNKEKENLNIIEPAGSIWKKSKADIKDNKNTSELKQYYIDFLKDNDYNNTDVIFSDPKQRKQLYNLLSKFSEVSELEAFLRKAKKNDFVVRNNYVPSILVSQFSQIAMSKDDWIKASF